MSSGARLEERARPAVLAPPRGLTSDRENPLGAPASTPWLRWVLIALDAMALAASWLPTLLVSAPAHATEWYPGVRLLAAMIIATAISVCLLASQHLHLARRCTVRAIELAGLWRVALISGFLGAVIIWALGEHPSLPEAIARSALAFMFLTSERSAYRSWLAAARRRGRFTRRVIIVGDNEDAVAWHRLLADHPELGFRVAGAVGSKSAALRKHGLAWLGEVDRASCVAHDVGATGALVAATALRPALLNRVIRDLLSAGMHVHVANGLHGIAYQRISPTSFCHESLFYVEQNTLARWQLVTKRAVDLVVSILLMVLSAPLVLSAALAIRVLDRAPVLFRQQRVGFGGREFTLYKLQTMVADAEDQLPGLRAANERSGPLFKLEDDPRVTWLGQFLRSTSIDELPQLINVIRGEMSLVGPRPALPSEVAEFDAKMLARHGVRPGITGLWQLEARDNPSFESYQRLDLHYVENWSVLLDLAILAATAVSVLGRGVRVLGRRAPRHSPAAPEGRGAALHGLAD